MGDQVTVTAAEIARLTKVERAAVSNWRRRHADFPSPVGGTAANPLYALQEVERWLAARGRAASIEPLDRLWQELRVYSEDGSLAEALGDVASFLSCEGLWDDWASQPDEVIAQRLPGAVVRKSRLPGQVPFPQGLRPAQVPFWRRLADIADRHPADDLFEELHSRYLDSTSRTAPATSVELASLIATMAEPGSTAFDPACGSGNLLRTLAAKTGASPAGQEIDPALARIAAFRLGRGDVRAGDSLRDDRFPTAPGYDLVACDPPSGVKEWGYEDLGYDPRWDFGLPPRAESELAWLQHCYAHLRPGGTVIMVMPIAAASRRSGRRIRGELLRRGALREVVALPPGLASGHSLGLHLWILTRPQTDAPQSPMTVRMIDASALGRDRLRGLADALAGEPGVMADVPVVDLLDDEVDLTPSRYIQRPVHAVADDHTTALAGLVPLLHRLMGEPPVRYGRADPPVPLPTVSIADLVKAGAVEVLLNRDAPGSGLSPRPGDILVPVLDAASAPTVLTEPLNEPPTDRHLLRCDPDVLDPYFVAGFLRSEVNVRQAVTGTGTFRYDVRRAVIPRLPLEEQRRYGAEFRRLADFAKLLHRAAALGDDVVRLAHDGLTTGVFDPLPEGE
ncbi:N-6 DNA methylase [Microbispora amethystogenes]|uniref:N-6 DNA methylase n=1 Tax=Microbispora amethystogenes TaxID=1427754 RepID=UPI0033D93A7F